MSTTSTEADRRLARARQYGFHASAPPPARFHPKSGSHDDGPGHGLFLGPVGGPVFSRDLHGRFSRWHLQPGMHLVTDVVAAFLAVRWIDGGEPRCARLRRDEARAHEVAVLHPLSHELFAFAHAPFRVLLTAFSPVIPGSEDCAALPVVVFDVDIEPTRGEERLPELDVAMFWPNLNGWRASVVTTTDRGDAAWPGHHHAGNSNQTVSPSFRGACVVQSRTSAVAGYEDTCGDVAVTVAGEADGFTQQNQFRLEPLTTGAPPAEQPYTLDAVVDAFRRTGRLGVTPDGSWETHWHESVGGAVAAHLTRRRESARLRFILTFDWPMVRFGQGRGWRRKYTAEGQRGVTAPAVTMAERAHREADQWLAEVDRWHTSALGSITEAGWSPEVAGCVVNELNLVVSLGTAWVNGSVDGHEPNWSPCPGSEHLGLLEGFDEGYFYYNTSDLWHYAFPALSLNWPRLADLLFTDLGHALEGEVPVQRPVYRPAEPRPLLVAGKLPHDLGNPAEDPFVRVNGYAMRDDPNTWRDSNPAFVLATLAHHQLLDRPLDEATWRRLLTAADLAAEQAGPKAGVPRHDEFGDSTWDNLGLRGHSTYTAGLCAGMWGVLARQCRARGIDPTPYELRLDAARAVLDELWAGRFYRAASEGKYIEALMPDSLVGLFYADLCNVSDIVDVDRVVTHLRTAYAFAHRGYHDGGVGPLLVAEEQLRRYERDGGQELQVNEVLVGSAWLFAAMLMRYGLCAEAEHVASALRRVLHGGTGLQFRTPAAVDGDGYFRAPLNMRPLAVWWLAATRPRSRT